LLGDADFLLVFRQNADADGLDQLAKEIECALETVGITVHIGLGAVVPGYFPSLPSSTFTYELKDCGRVVWGDDHILDSIPTCLPAKLPREDAWRTLNNRMIELLGCFDEQTTRSDPPETSAYTARQTLGKPLGPGNWKPETGNSLSPALHYAAVKLYLDMATSWLVFAGYYAPTYRERERKVRQLALDPTSDAPFALEAFAARVSEATAFKLHPSGTEDTYADASWDFLESALHHALQLWQWEASKLVEKFPVSSFQFPARKRVHTPHRKLRTGSLALETGNWKPETVVARVAERQRLGERLRGWASLLRRTGISSWRNWPRWAKLARQATPRYLVYGVAAELVWHLCHIAPASTARPEHAEGPAGPCLRNPQPTALEVLGGVDHPTTGSPPMFPDDQSTSPNDDVDWKRLQFRLPITLGDLTTRTDPRLQVIAELRWNYDKYLVETRA
jgi:hypothetical protein